MHQTFVTTSRGLQRESAPMRLFEKAKRYGIWNPSAIDFRRDAADWAGLTPLEKDVILRLTALFQAGEEAVTGDILPLIWTISNEGRLEEELFLTTFLFEEAKHTDFFRRFLDEVVGGDVVPVGAGGATTDEEGKLARYHGEHYRRLVYVALPTAMQALFVDPSPAAQIRAAVTYNMIVEGVLAETGYHAYLRALERNGLMPGQCQGIRLLKQDESRHIAYGLYLISRLIAEDNRLWDVAEATMNEMLPHALGVVADTFAAYTSMPFGLDEGEFINFALAQFTKRLARIEQACHQTVADVMEVACADVDAALDADPNTVTDAADESDNAPAHG
ncbi:MAG: R2-like ligand-binding oxidase [Caldilineaceae bacterium]|nr:R2-like ligand-binding oxidase [Caldilineaceae bacterium]